VTTSTVDAGTVDLGPGRPRLAVRRRGGPRRPFLLVHGLASNARLWDGVGEHLAALIAAEGLTGARTPIAVGQSWGGNVVLSLAALPDARVAWYPGADHDLHAQYPERLAADLLALAARTAETPQTVASRGVAPQTADVPEEAVP